jgi:hypothetical protein
LALEVVFEFAELLLPFWEETFGFEFDSVDPFIVVVGATVGTP